MSRNDIVRVIRILEYIGPRDWVESCLDRRAIKGVHHVQGRNARITEGLLGETKEVLSQDDPILGFSNTGKPDPVPGAGVSDSPPQP